MERVTHEDDDDDEEEEEEEEDDDDDDCRYGHGSDAPPPAACVAMDFRVRITFCMSLISADSQYVF